MIIFNIVFPKIALKGKAGYAIYTKDELPTWFQDHSENLRLLGQLVVTLFISGLFIIGVLY